jgi:cellulose biosynthesis protein BcsQ
MSNRFGIPAHSTGLGNALEDAGVLGGEELNAETGGKRLRDEMVQTPWPNIDLVPAGSRLGAIGQVTIEDTWLLRDMLDTSGTHDTHELILIDTAGRTGSLVSLAMYAADVAYAPIAPTMDAVRKAIEAKARVDRIQRAHRLRWAGVVLSGFDKRLGIDEAIRIEAHKQFPGEVQADIPRRATVHEAFQLTERLGDRSDVASSTLAGEFKTFLDVLIGGDK